ncbi:MAG: hypothetical protein SFX18_16970 [Pirellulales bacterium]|nr:hypothetical protein [Pirellulales bacterium]
MLDKPRQMLIDQQPTEGRRRVSAKAGWWLLLGCWGLALGGCGSGTYQQAVDTGKKQIDWYQKFDKLENAYANVERTAVVYRLPRIFAQVEGGKVLTSKAKNPLVDSDFAINKNWITPPELSALLTLKPFKYPFVAKVEYTGTEIKPTNSESENRGEKVHLPVQMSIWVFPEGKTALGDKVLKAVPVKSWEERNIDLAPMPNQDNQGKQRGVKFAKIDNAKDFISILSSQFDGAAANQMPNEPGEIQLWYLDLDKNKVLITWRYPDKIKDSSLPPDKIEELGAIVAGAISAEESLVEANKGG